MSADPAKRERIEELLAERAADGLDAAGRAELERLLAEAGHPDPDGPDLAAAWAWLGAGDADAPMPEAVAERARRTLQRGEPAPRAAEPRHQRDARIPAGAAVGWLAAAAAAVLAVAGWWPRLEPGGDRDLARARAELIETAPDVVRVEWRPTEHPRARRLDGGDVVWSDTRQRGYVTFRGIPENDPQRHQYQLWVFDAARSDRYPVAGGVFVNGGMFDVPGGRSEVIVPVRSRLPVRRAELFAVTLEPPGGAVVSDRDTMLWIARRGADR